jgi:hypothetical protein
MFGELVDRQPLVAEQPQHHEGQHDHRGHHRVVDGDAGEPHGGGCRSGRRQAAPAADADCRAGPQAAAFRRTAATSRQRRARQRAHRVQQHDVAFVHPVSTLPAPLPGRAEVDFAACPSVTTRRCTTRRRRPPARRAGLWSLRTADWRHHQRRLALQLDAAACEQALAQAGSGVHRQVGHHRARAALGTGVDARHRGGQGFGQAVDLQRARWPTRSATTSSGATAASSSSRDRSTISTSGRRPAPARPAAPGAATPGRTAARAVRCPARPCGPAPTPPGGLQRGTCAVGAADRGVERVARDEALVDQRLVVGQRALGDVQLRLAAAAWSSAWRRRQRNSVSSRRPISWPACTRSPSRTPICFTSAATLALTMALFTAFRPPDTGSVATSSVRSARATSPGGQLHRLRLARRPCCGGGCVAVSALRPAVRGPPAAASTSSHHQQHQDPAGAPAHGGHRPQAVRTLQAVQHEVDTWAVSVGLGVDAVTLDRAGAEGMFVQHQEDHRGENGMGHRGGVDRRNSPRSMPRWTRPGPGGGPAGSPRRCRTGQLGEVAHLGQHDLVQPAACRIGHAVPPDVEQDALSRSDVLPSKPAAMAAPSPISWLMFWRTTALNSSSLLG